MKETLDLVDEDDNIIGKIERSDCLKQAAIHRSVMIIVTNPKGEYLIQKRSGKKQLYPGMYEIGIGETLKSGETYEEASKRGLQEEAGIKGTPSFLFKTKFRSKNYNSNEQVYEFSFDGETKLDAEETEHAEFASMEKVSELLEKITPDSFAAFAKYLKPHEDQLDVVDEDDRVIGKASWGEVMQKKINHRLAAAIVLNKKGEIYVHKRSKRMLNYSGKYDVKFGGAVKSGENYIDGVNRELEEEAGIKNLQLKELILIKSRTRRLNANKLIFTCHHEGPFKLQKEEIDEGKFMSISEIQDFDRKGLLSEAASEIFSAYLRILHIEYLDIVNEDDVIIGKASWQEMMDNKLLHRTSNTFVFNSKGELFVHRRADHLKLYPGKWDVKFGGSVQSGEKYAEAAKRELQEEASISCEPKELFKMKTRRPEHNVNRTIFKCVYDGKIELDQSEVAEGKFVTIDQAKKMMHEGYLSPSAEDVFKEYLQHEAK